MIDREFLSHLRTMGIVEGISTLILFFVAVPLKYLAGLPVAVHIVGPIHGILFLVLAVMFMLGVQRVPISRSLAAAGIIAAMIPFAPFVLARWLNDTEIEAAR